jgi:hypothetical protein
MAIAQIINRANGIRGYTDETRLRGFEFFGDDGCDAIA